MYFRDHNLSLFSAVQTVVSTNSTDCSNWYRLFQMGSSVYEGKNCVSTTLKVQSQIMLEFVWKKTFEEVFITTFLCDISYTLSKNLILRY